MLETLSISYICGNADTAAFSAAAAITFGSAVVAADVASAAKADCAAKPVCIFGGAGFTGKPKYSYYKNGSYNISQSGTHRVLDNQTGDAVDYACSGANGTGTFLFGNENGGSWSDRSFSGVKSIVLAHDFPFGSGC